MSKRVSSIVFVLGCSLTAVAYLGGCSSETEAGENTEQGGFLRVADEPQAAPSGATAPELPPAMGERGDEPRKVPNPSAVDAEPAKPPEPSGGALDETAVEAQAAQALESGAFAQAAQLLSGLLLAHVESGRDDRVALGRWSALLQQAQAQHRWSPKGRWPSIEVKVQSGDSLIAVRKRSLAAHPELLLCTGQIQRANALASPTAIRPDDTLRVPTERASMLVDLSAMWAFYCFGDEVAAAFEVGVGREGSDTRPGTYTIGLKQENPMWSPVGREPVAFGDPANPLGTRWLAWHLDGRSTSLGFHGTNDPASVGRRISEGCIRMRNEDVERLFEILPLGAEVRVLP